MQRFKLIIKGGYGLTNFGDDALLYVLSKQLVPYFNQEDISFACYKNKYNERYTNGFNIIDVKDFKYTPTKLLVYGGGTQFYNFKKPPSIIKVYLSKIKQIILGNKKSNTQPKNINYSYLASIGIGIGPFINDINNKKELLVKNEFEKMSFVSIRDTSSADMCKKWKLNNYKLEADICYSMNHKYFFQKNEKENIKKIGIILRDWDHTNEGRDYYDKINKLTAKLEKDNFEITLILFATKSDSHWNKEKINYSNILEWEPSKMSIDSFICNLNKFDLFITARYHGAVFATLLGKPFISIVVEQKLSLISDIFANGSKQWAHPFSIEECIKKVHYIDNKYIEHSNEINKEAEKQKILSEEMFDRFIIFCNEKNLTKD